MTQPVEEVVKEKPKKAKKQISDFEIVKTIFQKTHEYRLPFLLKNTGEHSDIYFLSSVEESKLVYGDPKISIGMIEITDEVLREKTLSVFQNLKGFDNSDRQLFINVKQQMSQYGKDKEEGFGCEIFEDKTGSSWIVKKDINGRENIVQFVKSVDDLFQMHYVKAWCDKYRSVLSSPDESFERYPVSFDDKEKVLLLTLGRPERGLQNLYPDGFRMQMIKGVDLIVDTHVAKLDYPILNQEIIVFRNTFEGRLEEACQLVHRIEAEGWRMILLRPNSVIFPKSPKPLEVKGK